MSSNAMVHPWRTLCAVVVEPFVRGLFLLLRTISNNTIKTRTAQDRSNTDLEYGGDPGPTITHQEMNEHNMAGMNRKGRMGLLFFNGIQNTANHVNI
jgi:hypothetical protein